MKQRSVGFALLCLGLLAAVSRIGCGGSGSDSPAAGGAAGAAGSASQAGRAGSSGRGGGGSGAAAAGGTTAGKAGTSATGGQAGGGCANFVGSNDGFVTVPPCPAEYSCGPGCRPVFSISYPFNSLSEFQLDATGVVDTTQRRLLVSTFGDGQTYSVGLTIGKDKLASPMLSDSYVLGRHYTLPAPADSTKQSELRVWDRKSGTLLKTIPMPGTTNGESPYYFGGASTDKYALLSFDGKLTRFDIATGTSQVIGASSCAFPQILAGRYTCLDEVTGKFTSIDIETGATSHPGAGPALQIEGRCSVDGASCAWVDYRDPPGPGSNLFKRFGGEIYVYAAATKTLERVTFDSPDNPTWKFHAAVEDDLVAWLEVSTKPTAPGDVNTWISVIDRIAKYDRKSGQRCTYAIKGLIGSIIYKRKLYGTNNDADMLGGLRVVALDLDSTEIPWVCNASPPPVVVQ